MSAYNLFRKEGCAAFYCAVPEDRVLPSFVRGPVWVFSGRVEDGGAHPLAFDMKAAETGARFNGFHLLPCFEAERLAAR